MRHETKETLSQRLELTAYHVTRARLVVMQQRGPIARLELQGINTRTSRELLIQLIYTLENFEKEYQLILRDLRQFNDPT